VERDEIVRTIRELRPWYHNIYLGNGIWTKDLKDPENIHPGMDIPRPLWNAIERVLPRNMTGMSALDVGCNAGFFSFKLRERGARVLGIDSDQGATQSFIKQAEFCKLVLGLDVDFRRQGLLDLPESSQFDLILFLGVLYHLPNFCDGLDRLRRLCKPGGIVAVESQVATRSVTCYEGKGFRGDPTTFFVPSIGVLKTLLTEHGFAIEQSFRLGKERYFCLGVSRPHNKIYPGGRNRDATTTHRGGRIQGSAVWELLRRFGSNSTRRFRDRLQRFVDHVVEKRPALVNAVNDQRIQLFKGRLATMEQQIFARHY
jgi:tRNA (mo5U34)-methyltransferase